MFVILSGCSAVGKNTIINKLLGEPNSPYILMPTYTTRSMRPGEREGFPYHYLTVQQFEDKIASGELYEYEKIHNNYYGSSRLLLADALTSGKIILKDIDVKGSVNLSRILKDDIKVISIFLYADKEVLSERLRLRGDSQSDIEIRLGRYDEEMTYKDKSDYQIENLDLDKTVRKIKRIIAKESKTELS